MKGFTLLETLVAVTIIMIAIVGPISVMHRTYKAAYIAHDKLIASYLAQEGIENVRAIRDNKLLVGAGWSGSPSSFVNYIAPCEAGACRVDDPPDLSDHEPKLVPCRTTAQCAVVMKADASGVVRYRQLGSGGTKTIYTRTIQSALISGGNPDEEEQITSEVTWLDHGTQYSVQIVDHLTPWQ